MSIILPKPIERAIKEYVFKLADEQNYLSTSKIENGQFMDRLVADPKAGKKLESYIGKDKIRTYIKDAVLNRYTKQRRNECKPSNLGKLYSDKLGIQCHEVETSKETTLIRCEAGGAYSYIVSVDGTYTKWETALRKALLFAGNKPFAKKSSSKILIHLNLFTPAHITDSDKKAIRLALAIIGAECDFYVK